MTDSGKISLSFEEFDRSISTSWQAFRNENYFSDVTLACEDRQVESHRLILSASSMVFKQLLIQNPHQHPLLYLRGVKYSDLVAILDFIYLGEAIIPRDNINEFIKVAKELGIKGLADHSSSQVDANKNSDCVGYQSDEEPTVTGPINIIHGEDEIFDIALIEDNAIIDEILKNVNDAQVRANKSNFMFACPKCTFKTDRKINLKIHIRCVHLDIRNCKVLYSCDQCGYRTSRKNNYMRHMSCSTHKENGIPNQTCMNNFDEVDCDTFNDDRMNESDHEDTVAVNGKLPNSLCNLYKLASNETKCLNSMHDKALFSCDKCDFKTAKKFCYSRHVESGHERVRITCDHCDYKTSSKGNMKIHFKKNHEEEYKCKISQKYNTKKHKHSEHDITNDYLNL